MRPRINRFSRRARRLVLTSPVLSLWRYYARSRPPPKHIKIDDEEQLRDDLHYSPKNTPTPLRRIVRLLLLILLAIIFIAIVGAYIIYKPPNFVIRYLQWKYPSVLFHVPLPASERVVALTLDDAPSRETAKILDLLKAYGAKATFFVIGSHIDDYPELVQRIHDEGHEIGNHMWRDEPTISLAFEEVRSQLAKVEAKLPPNADGTKYFRPGSGVFNNKMVDIAGGAGYKTILGSIFPFDPQIPSAKINSAHVLSMARPGGIIIMHENRPWSTEQLERVLKGLTANKWKVETVGGLLQTARKAVSSKKTGG